MVFPTSNLSGENVLRDVHDQDEQRLRVDAQVTAIVENVTVEVDLDAANDNVAIKDPATNNILSVNDDGSIKTVQLFTKAFDAITATYPTSSQEVYVSRVGGISGTIQETVTVNYTDSTKILILNVARV